MSSAEATAEYTGLWKWRPYSRSTWAVGWDVGQSHDPSALAVEERVQWYRVNSGRSVKHVPAEVVFRVPHLERLPLQMLFPQQREHVRRLMASREKLRDADLVIDATGVGKGVFDEILAQGDGRAPIGIWITGGDGWRRDRGLHYVAKRELIGGLQGLMHTGELKVAEELAEAPVLLDELVNYEMNFTDTGAMRFGAREGKHDDLILALACATWWLKHRARSRVASVAVPGMW